MDDWTFIGICLIVLVLLVGIVGLILTGNNRGEEECAAKQLKFSSIGHFSGNIYCVDLLGKETILQTKWYSAR